MLHRSTSSRRRRASRSAASSPQTRSPRSAATSPGRRASIAVSPVDGDQRDIIVSEMNRSPRHSIIPDISLAESNCNRSPRPSITSDMVPSLSPRNSLMPPECRSPRNSLVPGDAYNRSPRNSLVPDSALSPRNSLVPGDYNRSPRNTLVPEVNRSPRHSLVPDNAQRLNVEYNRSPRNSLVPDGTRTPRRSLVPSESSTWKQSNISLNEDKSGRYNETEEIINRSPRGSIAPDSLCLRTSPRGSIASEYPLERSPRGSIGPETAATVNRSPRGSIGRSNLVTEDRSPRGSLTLTFQEPPVSERRASADNPAGNRNATRSTSPYRSGSRGTVNLGYSSSVLSEGGSRRASSSVSQVSGDEQRRLCSEQKYAAAESGLGLAITLTTYGSVAYQLKDANLEASGTCDFVCKAISIVNKTVAVTVILVCLSTLPLLMLIMGSQFLRDCPREPYIPVYMVVGGSVGCIKMAWVLYNQLHTRRLEIGTPNATSYGAKATSLALTLFLMSWFALGNYWILKIKWPDFSPTLFEPNRWCHRTLYVFAIVHLYIIYTVMGCVVVLVITLAGFQLFGCSFLGPARYK